MELLDLNLVIDSNNDLKRELAEHLKQIDESQIKLNLNCEQKLKEIKEQINSIRLNIKNRVNQLIDELKENEEKLLYKTDNIENNLKYQIDSCHIELYKNKKIINEMNKTDLNNFKDELNKLKLDLDFKFNQLKEIQPKYEFKANATIPIGDILDQKQQVNISFQLEMFFLNYFRTTTKKGS